jgi:hypothetical protein
LRRGVAQIVRRIEQRNESAVAHRQDGVGRCEGAPLRLRTVFPFGCWEWGEILDAHG